MDLEQEFKRQVRLCSGLGVDKMIQIVKEQFPPQHKWQFYVNGTFCTKCGRNIGQTVNQPCDY